LSSTVCQPPFASEPFVLTVDRMFARALAEKTFSGASLLVATPDSILFHKTWGRTRRRGRHIDSHTLFDLASLTKPLITAPLYMRAVSEGKFALDTTLLRYFPEALLGTDKKTISFRQLLNHSSGLPAYRPFYRELIAKEPARREDVLFRRILRTSLDAKPGTVACYSDLGFLLLPHFLERIYDKPFGKLATEFLLEPLNLNLMNPKPRRQLALDFQDVQEGSPLALLGFRSLRVSLDPTLVPGKVVATGRIFAATEYCPWRNRLLIGEVHDENAYCLGGVAAHAGLFGTAHGVYRLLTFLWEVYAGRVTNPFFSAETVREFWREQSLVTGSTWRLGFDSPSPQNSSAGKYFSPRSIGHLGFTGTSFWFDLDQEILIILLTNRVYPTRENERLRNFRPLLHNLVMETYHGAAKL
jgi:serine-type D-Ala-D-Ala carboxypeptidase